MSGRRRHRAGRLVPLAIVGGLLAGCTGGGDASPTATGPEPSRTEPTDARDPADRALVGFDGIALREGQSPAAPTPAPTVVECTPLDDAAIAAVLSRLEAFLDDDAETMPFNWPAETIARPIGERTDVEFPATDDADSAIWVTDRNSTNGTVVVDPAGVARVLPAGTRALVGHGWTVRLGDREARVEAD